jgi:hypothetical protein
MNPNGSPQNSKPRPVRNLISRKKAVYPISDFFREYLERYDRLESQGVRYEDLQRFEGSIPLYDEEGNDTFWSTVYYRESEQREIHNQLRTVYAILKSDGDLSAVEQLYI